MEQLTETVLKNNYCIGCGACAVASNSFNIKFNDYGQYQAYPEQHSEATSNLAIPEKVCPFSNSAINESQLSTALFPHTLQENEYLGKYQDLYFGHSNSLRKLGASGGLTTWFILKALREKVVDAVIHLKEKVDRKTGEIIFEYGVSSSPEEVLKSAATKYYPGELSSSLQQVILGEDIKYAVVGVPCFIKSVRLLASQIPIIKERIVLHIGLVCGHYKSANYALMLALQKEILPHNLKKINFRHKSGEGKAGDYNTYIEHVSESGEKLIHNETVKNFYGTDWGLGMFKYNACDYCDDVVAETADVVFGDAWISPYVDDPMGTNIIISRSSKVSNFFTNLTDIEKEDLYLENASSNQIIKTQLAGFRHRREGLKLRLYWKNKSKQWYPQKRFSPDASNSLGIRYKMIYRMRLSITKMSHIYFKDALKNNSFETFEKKMARLVFIYKYILYGPNRLKIFLASMKNKGK
jgi:coenzyme F420 hydrogenase subunit beta